MGLPGAPGSISSLGGGDDRGRFAGNRRQRGVVKIPNPVCGACSRPTSLRQVAEAARHTLASSAMCEAHRHTSQAGVMGPMSA